MSSTNKTTNYDLSQFIGTDKPAWLSDYNGDMGKIDTGIHTAQTTATGADGKATANASAIGTLSSLTTEAKTNLVAAVNEVNTNASTAINTASNAAGTANNALATANALANYFTLNVTEVASNNMVPTGGTIDSRSNAKIALNSTASAGKIYGLIRHNASSAATTYDITLNIDSGIHPSEEFVIAPAGLAFIASNVATGWTQGQSVSLRIKPNGNIVVRYYAEVAGNYFVYLWPCLYFLTDFGDTQQQ